MPLASLGFLVGVLICQSLTELPVREWGLIIIVLIPLVLRFPGYRFAILLLIGFLYSVLIAHSKLSSQIPPELEGRDLLVSGTVTSINSRNSSRTRFLLSISDLSELTSTSPAVTDSHISPDVILPEKLPQRIQLSWYKDPPNIIVGQRWQLKVRLKRPRGFSNPGGFDYEGWLYQNGIDATGYVRSGKHNLHWNRLLGKDPGLLSSLNRFRAKLSDRISQALQDRPHSSLIVALVVGDRQYMTDREWSTLTRTGTNHLMAISGLHIGLVAGLIFSLSNWLWRLIPGAASNYQRQESQL